MTESKQKLRSNFSEIPTRGGRQLLASFIKNAEICDFLNANNSQNDKIDQKTGLIHRTLINPLTLELQPEESRHALKVLRLREGEIVRIIDSQLKLIGQGVLKIKNQTASVKIKVVARLNTNYPDILIGIPENKTAEACIEKLTEMGVNSIIFFNAEFSQKTAREFEKLEARLLKKRDVAIKQSYSLNAPSIEISLSLSQALKNLNYSSNQLVTLFSPKDAEVIDEHKIRIENLVTLFNTTIKPRVIVVGPEGGFSLKELETLITNQSRFLTLGTNTLRVETAASLAIAAVHALGNSSKLITNAERSKD